MISTIYFKGSNLIFEFVIISKISIFTKISFVIAFLNAVLPMNKINKLIFKVTDDKPLTQNYQEVET